MRTLKKLFVLAFLTALLSLHAWAQDRAALALRVRGQIQHGSSRLQPFELLMVGDELVLGADSEVTLGFVRGRNRVTLSQPGRVRLTADGVQGDVAPRVEVANSRLPARLPREMWDFSKMAGTSTRAGMITYLQLRPTLEFDLSWVRRNLRLSDTLTLSYRTNESWHSLPLQIDHHADGRTIGRARLELPAGVLYQVYLGGGASQPDFQVYHPRPEEEAELKAWEEHLRSPQAGIEDFLAYAASLHELGLTDEAKNWLELGRQRFPDSSDWVNAVDGLGR